MIKMRCLIALIIAFSVLPVSAVKRRRLHLPPDTGVKKARVLVRPSPNAEPRLADGAEIVLPAKGLYWFNVGDSSSFVVGSPSFVEDSSSEVVLYEPSAHYYTRESCEKLECWQPIHDFAKTKNPESTAIKVKTRPLLVVWWRDKMTDSKVDCTNRKIEVTFQKGRVTISWRWIGEPPALIKC